MQWTSSNALPWSWNRYVAFVRTAATIPSHPSAMAMEINDSGRGYIYSHMKFGPTVANPKNVAWRIWQQNEVKSLLYFASKEGTKSFWKEALQWYIETEDARDTSHLTEEALKRQN